MVWPWERFRRAPDMSERFDRVWQCAKSVIADIGSDIPGMILTASDILPFSGNAFRLGKMPGDKRPLAHFGPFMSIDEIDDMTGELTAIPVPDPWYHDYYAVKRYYEHGYEHLEIESEHPNAAVSRRG